MCVLLACSKTPSGLRWVVPEKFEGCVTTRFQVKGAPPLPMEDGWYLISAPPDGQVTTSTKPLWGERLQTEFYAQSAMGRRRVQPSCDGGTTTNVAEGTVKLTFCFGPISQRDCLRIQGAAAE
ncbi:hypothetical protein [Vitiosangium sp. GDMCC 1.1324]|uniref:DUF6843 domain-containing protein n=1 Tax=Vitiosangium sp. (strain GDMCC 1.1324) TaxID=2138576 RepID=UPI003519817A